MTKPKESESKITTEEEYDLCDNCRQYKTVISCPSYGEDIEHSWVPDNICEECCKDLFEFDPSGCINSMDDCPRVEQLQIDRIRELTKDEFKPSEKHQDVIIDNSGSIAIGFGTANVDKVFGEKSVEIDALYEGKDYILVQVSGKTYSFPRQNYEKILELLDEIGEEDLEFLLMINKGFFIVRGYGVFALLTSSDINYAYSTEKSEFICRVKNGYDIFKNDITDELTIVDLRTPNYNWTKLKPNEFEDLCCAILSSFESFSGCTCVAGSGDEGRDIIATEAIKTATGTEVRKWLVQCKHYPNRSISRREIEDLNTLYTRFKFDVYCLMTSGKFGPNSMRSLDAYEAEGYVIKRMPRAFLEDCIKKHPEILEKFPKLCKKTK